MTAQIHEVLIIEGEELSMAFCPPLPADHPRIVPDDLAKIGEDDPNILLRSTACWRGYQGTWEIKDGRMFLVRLEGRYRLDGAEPLAADWFTGTLRVPQGEELHYVHMGFGSVYEMEIHVKVERGIVVASKTIDNRGKPTDPHELARKNLPGGENRFPGDDDL